MAATEPTRDRSSLFGGKKPIGGFALPGLAGKLGLGPKLPDKSKERASEEPKVPEKGKDEKGEKEKGQRTCGFSIKSHF